MKSEHDLSEEQKNFVRRVVRDPVLFARHILGVEIWEREAEILQSIKCHRRTAVKACHGVGKTFTLAVGVLWWLARYRSGVALITSATQRQVRTQVWLEIHRLAENSKVKYPKLKTQELKFRDETNFAIGFSTNQSENFQGYHARDLLIIVDEASGIAPGISEAIAGTMAGGNVHVVMAGNPTAPSGPFYDAFTKDRALWNLFTINAFDSPNLKGFTLEQLLDMDSREGGPLDDNPYPQLVAKRWVYEHRQIWWNGTEASSPNWMSRVLAEFPDQSEFALFKLAWLERARKCADNSSPSGTGSAPLVAGIDVGGGAAETVAYVCENRHDKCVIVNMRAWRGEETRGDVVRFLNEYRSRLTVVRVDAIGVGHNFGLHLRDCRFPVEMINVALPCESKPHLGDSDPARRFANRKAHYYQSLADAFERDQVEGLTDETTIGQLATILYEHDSLGRMKIESKEDARARGVTALDRCEALMLALCKPPIPLEFISVRSARVSNGFKPYGRLTVEQQDALDDTRADYERMMRRHGRRFTNWGKKGAGF